MDGDPDTRAIAEMHLLKGRDGYCADEDDVVPLGYAAEIIRRRKAPPPSCDCERPWGCDTCTVPLDFPLES
jgi:hypothetical protein